PPQASAPLLVSALRNSLPHELGCSHLLSFSALFFLGYAAHRDLHSFPTRRSSDLPDRNRRLERRPEDRLVVLQLRREDLQMLAEDRKSTRLNSSHLVISYAVFCLKKKKDIGARRCGPQMSWRRRCAGIVSYRAGRF